MTDTQTTTSQTFTFGGQTATVTTTKTQVTLTDQDRADLANAATYFSGQPNNAVLSVNFPSEGEASDYRAKINAYADQHNLSAGFPKFADEHWTKEVVDDTTGKVTKPKKLIPANKYPRDWNVGTNITFRLTSHRKTESAGEVTTTTVAERAAATKAGAELAAKNAEAAAASKSK